jgi:hypothetical protein
MKWLKTMNSESDNIYPASEMLTMVAPCNLTWTNVSEETITYIFRVENQKSGIPCCSTCLATCCTLVSCSADFRPCRWSWQVPQKHRFTYGLRSPISQKMETFVLISKLFLSGGHCECNDERDSPQHAPHWPRWHVTVWVRQPSGQMSGNSDVYRLLHLH